jgi:hypothetical protein
MDHPVAIEHVISAGRGKLPVGSVPEVDTVEIGRDLADHGQILRGDLVVDRGIDPDRIGINRIPDGCCDGDGLI